MHSSQKRILRWDVIVEVNGHETGPSVSKRMVMLLIKRERIIFTRLKNSNDVAPCQST